MLFNQLYPPQTNSVEELRRWCVSLVDSLRLMFNNLDEQNVVKAGSVAADGVEPGELTDVTINTGSFNLDDEGKVTMVDPDINGLKVWSPDGGSYLEFTKESAFYKGNNVRGCLRICDSDNQEKFAIVFVKGLYDDIVYFISNGRMATIDDIVDNND